MNIAYSREAMHALLALPADARQQAITEAERLAAPATTVDAAAPFASLVPLAGGSDVRLAPFAESGDLVVMREDDTLVVLALIDVIGAVKEAGK